MQNIHLATRMCPVLLLFLKVAPWFAMGGLLVFILKRILNQTNSLLKQIVLHTHTSCYVLFFKNNDTFSLCLKF